MTISSRPNPILNAVQFWHVQQFASPRFVEETPFMLQTLWLPEMSSGLLAIDDLHQDFFEALERISLTDDREFCAGYAEFTKKIEHIFRQEDQWMDEIDFPGIKAHQEQHARILSALHHTGTQVMGGDYELGRKVINVLLPQWFAFHSTTMDAALAYGLQLAQQTAETESVLKNNSCVTPQ